MQKWILRNPKFDFKKMSKELGISELLCRIIVNRGIKDIDNARKFIKADNHGLYDPRQMKDLVKGVSIIQEKIKNNKKIRIIGDYDVDGVVSTYILYKAFARCGAVVDYAIPHRILDGYGINNSLIEKALNDGIDTIITCDNGIAAKEQIQYARESGMTVIVTDHHDVPDTIPEADAIIDMKQPDCQYPFKLLCGAGVAFKFIQVLYEEMCIPREEESEFYEFVAIATVCDVVDLTDENRILVRQGLNVISDTKNIGLCALLQKTGILGKNISVYHLGFIIGPCINASGRLDWAMKGLELLLTDDEKEAMALATELYELNNERKHMTVKGVEDTIETIENSSLKSDRVFVVYKPDIHESIAGIIAGKVRERYNVPTFILTSGENCVKGSGRSIEEYNMFEELSKCKELFTKFGGHPMAAGFSLDADKVDILRERINSITTLTDDDLIAKVYIDAHIPLSAINIRTAEELNYLEPYGKGNSKPLFAEKNISIKRAGVFGNERKVLKLRLQGGTSFIDCIYFGDIDEFDAYVSERFGNTELQNMYKGRTNKIKLDMIFNIEINEYNGYKNVQVVLQYYR
ncbi:single-stranded-DNA-specific exonuclease RecJ [Ruminiclostridium cellulolyticum]|uniref:Single-stranded-DNA-specific exonuclease RecJ n=1 Tax=Ruminiclostridium cellulolyticum (strain ATCC 35319 / DSM 5812 / JCM 6584 / H10) TaxID=394503 RepID=B8I3F8_RUMCH|nr:single-stranded-DNA-specific exonuclease RecJ [Ruminiclostridium cellulolyticum]ACL76301.1 single-stranded-DNA-specific exonuclease RecJ [Ruminiclostridium cellulolyticum H10]